MTTNKTQNGRTISEITLTSNGYTLASTPNRLGWLESTDPSLPISTLREQFGAQGYLWLKGILDRQEVLDFRRRYFLALRETGLLKSGTDPVEGIYGGGGEQKTPVRDIVLEAVRWAAYEAFCLMKPIWNFYEEFLGGPVYLHKRKIIRHENPGSLNCTGAHYDLTYLRGGSEKVYTSWIPIGDVPVEMGGLLYLEGSDAFGRKTEAEFTAKNMELPPEERISAYNKNMTQGGWLTKDLPSLAERLDTRWLMADYEAGDMVVHSAFMIHAASLNQSAENRIRVSTDIRYQLVNEKIDERWSNDWTLNDKL